MELFSWESNQQSQHSHLTYVADMAQGLLQT